MVMLLFMLARAWAANVLIFSTQPSTVSLGTAFSPAITVALVDSITGAAITGTTLTVYLSMDNGSLDGTVWASTSSTTGIATFSTNVKPLMAGSRQLVALASSSAGAPYDPVFSSIFSVFEQSAPTSAEVSGSTSLTPGTYYTFTVTLFNIYTLPYTTSTSITLNLYDGSNKAVLKGTTTVSSTSLGTSTFSLSLDGPGGTYYLYPTIKDSSIMIYPLTITLSSPTSPTTISLSAPSIVGLGVPFSLTATLYVGQYSLLSSSRSLSVSISPGSFTSSTTSGTTSSGSYTFTNLKLSTSSALGTHTLTVTDTASSLSNSFTIEAEKRTSLNFILPSEPYFLKTVGTYTYSLYLSSQPSANVQVSIASGSTSIITVSPSSVTFTSSDYSTGKSVVLTVISSGVSQMQTDVLISHSITTTDTGYSTGTVSYYGCDRVSSSGTLTVTVLNTLVPGTLALSGSFYVQAGSSSSFSVHLTQATSSAVRVTLSNSDGLTFSPTYLDFTSGNYYTSQSVTVSGSNVQMGSASSIYSEIEYSISSTDSRYSNAIASNTGYVIVSSSSAAAKITQSKFPVLNEGSSSTYTLALTLTPTSSVAFTLTPSSSEITLDISSFSVSSTAPTTITVTHSPSTYPTSLIRQYTIHHSLSSADPNFNLNNKFSIAEDLPVYVINTCVYGQYLDASYTCVSCPDNYRCPSPIDREYCAGGEYSPSGQYECLPCPPGYECNPSTTGKVACAPGYYSLGSATACTQCPAGSACTLTTTAPADCPLGTYSAAGSTSCTAHTAGNVGFPSASPTTCASGTIPSAYFTHCEQCPAGHYCSDPTTRTITPCAAGYYSVGGASSCTQCPAGSACSRTANVGTCPNGYYSDAGKGSCVVCPAGYYCTSGAKYSCSGSYQTGLSACGSNACPAQHYCTQGLPPMPCPPGYISASGSLTCTACASGEYQSANTCTTCPAGYFCPTPASPPIACYFGTYSSSGATSCTICNSGYTCGQGSSSATQLDCPSGHDCTTSITAMTGVTVRWPVPCAAGYYNTGSTSACSTCPNGYYCPGGVQDYQKFRCPPGHYCSSGSVKPTNCNAGYYNPSWSSYLSSDCVICPDGYFSFKGAPYCLVCPPGYYCASGVKTACSSGSYYFGVRGTSSSVCKSCPAGYYCSSSSNSGTIVPTACPPYTIRTTTGAASLSDCSSCPAGSLCPLPSSKSSSKQFPCPPGQYCSSGVNSTECLAGTYSDTTSASSISTCLNCPAGYICPLTSTSSSANPPLPCPPGQYCASGSSSGTNCPAGSFSNKDYLTASTECTTCPAGYYCPAGSTYPIICPPGQYCGRGSSTSTACPAGYYNPFRGVTIVSNCIKCPKGYYCVSGDQTPTKCNAGYYSLGGTSTCTSCAAGYYCPDQAWYSPLPCGKGYYSSGTASSCSQCTAGRYCPIEVTTNTLRVNTYKCPAGLYCGTRTDHYPTNLLDRCDPGYYCLATASAQTACPVGTLRRIPGGASAADCIDVEPGYYVSTTGASAPTGQCSPGYYCTGGSSTATQNACPQGTYRLIAGGTSAASCGSCPAGSYCTSGTSTPTQCPTGKYCPEGSTSGYIDCPSGTYNPGSSMYKLADCLDCPKGYYCSGTGRTSKSGACAAGYYCYGAAINNVGYTAASSSYSYCPAGGYCPAGTPRPIPCPPGKYMPSSGQSSASGCSNCPAGKYCAGAGSSYSGLCEAGFYCTGSATTSRQYITNAGYYSLAGASTQTACSPGTFNPSKGQSSCQSCPAGFYCPSSAMTSATICQQGKYCPAGSSSGTNCPSGTYNPFTGMKSLSDCTSCPPTYACTSSGMTSVSTQCNAGYWCYSNSPSASPSSTLTNKYGPCPSGHYCISGSSAPRPCGPGKYNPNTYSTSSSACISCTAGSYCEGFGNSAVSGSCEAGFYCPTGMKVKRPIDYICPAGYRCPTGSSSPTQCSAGTFQANKGQSVCETCPAGFYCPAGTTDFSVNVCPAGYYCPAGTTYSTQYPCSAGTYNPIAGATSSAFCISCDPGKYCSSSGRSSVSGTCSGGYICTGGSTTATPTSSGGSRCGQGYYCPSGGSVQVKCKAGHYCSSSGLSSPTGQCSAGYYCISLAISATPDDSTGHPCPQGFYCPQGSVSPVPCPAGTYNPDSVQSSISACLNCPSGYYCQGTGLYATSGLCEAGYYCPEKSISSKAIICDPGYYCPEGSSTPTACNIGEYQSKYAQSACLTCPAGYFCDSTATVTPTLCNEGYYCPEGTGAGTDFPCSYTYYNPAKGRFDASSCLPCLPGFYCPTDGLSLPAGTCMARYYCNARTRYKNSRGCPRGYYCPDSATFYLDCPPGKACTTSYLAAPNADCAPGYFCTLRARMTNPPDSTQGGGPCPAGYYCPSGTFTPYSCPIGTYNPDEYMSSLSDCLSCPAGYYCDILATTTYSGSCQAGYYCVSGSTSATPKDGLCPLGSYCPAGSSSPISCPPGTHSDHEGMITCTECPSSFTCAGGAAEPVICPAGYYCTSGQSTPTPCSPGTYNPFEGLSECIDCPYGFYCDDEDSTQSLPILAPTVCTAGFYCPVGEIHTCPSGTYSEILGLQREDNCKPCPGGSYCTSSDEVGGQVSGECDKGYFCVSGNDSPTPSYVYSDYVVGMPCPLGYYCLEGTKKLTPCPYGKFTQDEGSDEESDCTDCIEGFYCVPGDTVPYACPVGAYCPTGSQVPVFCPIWTYSDAEKAVDESTCVPCPKGYLCNEEGIGDVTRLPCRYGHYCTAGAVNEAPCPIGTWGPLHALGSANECFDCPAGSYCKTHGRSTYSHCDEFTWCPEGSYTKSECPPGYYCHHNTQVLETCPGGYYCPSKKLGVMSPPYRCEEGYYCPPGSSSPQKCPWGTVSIVNSLRITVKDSCAECPPGTYSQGTECLNCDPGFLCEMGASKAQPQSLEEDGGYPCPPGFYCPGGSYEGVPCPVGTYYSDKGAVAVEDCKVCEPGYYNDIEGQGGCYKCGPNAYSSSNSTTCLCIGAFRSYMKKDATCRCQPGYSYYKFGTQISDSDSDQDCVPNVIPICQLGEIRGHNGTCVLESDCSNECQGGQGKRSADLGICTCNDSPSISDICDLTCQSSTPTVKLTSEGVFIVSDPTTLTSTSIDFQSTPGYTGKPKCLTGYNCAIKTAELDASGNFISDYQPTLITGSQRRLTSSKTLKNPIYCLEYGDTMVFSIPSSTTFPVYVKDSLLNTNPDFDYSPFIELKKLIQESQQNLTSFAYTFTDPGRYVFASYDSPDSLIIITVMESTQKCESPYIRERSTVTLSIAGVYKSSNINEESDWTQFVFIVCVSFCCVFYLTSAYIVKKRNMKKLTEQNKKAYREMLARHASLIQMQNEGVGVASPEDTDDLLQYDALNPQIFEQIYRRLLDINKLIKDRAEYQKVKEKGFVKDVKKSLREVKTVVHDALNPPVKTQLIEIPQVHNEENSEIPVFNPLSEPEAKGFVDKILKEKGLSDNAKHELIQELKNNFETLEARLNEDKINAGNNLKHRIEERNRERRRMMIKSHQLEEQERSLRDRIQKELRNTDFLIKQVDRDYEKELRRARESVFGTVFKSIRTDLLEKLKKNPDQESVLLSEYESRMSQLEEKLEEDKKKTHFELLKKLEDRRTERKKKLQNEAEGLMKKHQEVLGELGNVNKLIELSVSLESETVVEVGGEERVWGLSEGDERNIDRKFREMQKNQDILHDQKQSMLGRQKEKLNGALMLVRETGQRNKILEEILRVESAIFRQNQEREAEQKQLLAERLRERRRLRKEREEKGQETIRSFKVHTVSITDEAHLEKLKEIISNLPENSKLQTIKQLLSEKHDKELTVLQSKQLSRLASLHRKNFLDFLDLKTEALRLSSSTLTSLSPEKQSQAILSILSDSEKDSQSDFSSQFKLHQQQCNEEILHLLDIQMQEVSQSLIHLNINSSLSQDAQDLERDFLRRQATMESESHTRFQALEKHRNELSKLAQDKQQELDQQIASHKKHLDQERSKKLQMEKEKKELQEKVKKGEMTQKQMESLIAQHQQDLHRMEASIEQEKLRQRQILDEKLQKKQKRKNKLMKVPEDLRHLKGEIVQMMKKFRSMRHHEAEFDENIIHELYRRVSNIEQIVYNIDRNQIGLLNKRLRSLKKGIIGKSKY